MKKLLLLVFTLLFKSYFLNAQCVVSITSSNTNVLCNNDSVLLTPSPGFTIYLWSTGDTTRTIYAKENGYYKVVAKDINNCIAVDSILVRKIEKPSFTISGRAMCDSSSFIFTNNTPTPFTNVSKFIWNYGDGTQYVSGLPNSAAQDLQRWTQPYTKLYITNNVFKPTLIVFHKNVSCIDTFNYESTGQTLPQNIIYQIEILTKKSATNNGNSDSICVSNNGGGMVTLYNKFPLDGLPLFIKWHFHDNNANPPGSDNAPFNNVYEPTYNYQGLGQYFPTLTVQCPGTPIKTRTYTYYSKIDTLPKDKSKYQYKDYFTSNGTATNPNSPIINPILYTRNGKILSPNTNSNPQFYNYNGRISAYKFDTILNTIDPTMIIGVYANHIGWADSMSSNWKFFRTNENNFINKWVDTSTTTFRNPFTSNLITVPFYREYTNPISRVVRTTDNKFRDTLIGIGINVIGAQARIENLYQAGGPQPPRDVIMLWQKQQCGPTFPVQFVNNSLAYQANKIWLRWDFNENNFAPACTSYSLPNPSAIGGGNKPYFDASDLQSRTIGAFIANGKAYLGRLNSCNFSHDSIPTRQYTNWDVVFDWYRYGHDFPPYDSTKWAVGYTVWPTTQNPPVGKNWVQPRDSSTWKKPMTAFGPTPTRIDTMNIWPLDLQPNKAILIDKVIPDPFAAAKGYWNFSISPGHSITPNGFITPNDLGNLPNGQSRNYRGSDTLPGISPPITFYKYVFNRIIAKQYNVVLNMQDSAAKATGSNANCASQSSIILNFTKPDAYGLGKDGIEGVGFISGNAGGNSQIVFDNSGYLDKEKTKPAPGISSPNERTLLLINYDSLLDRNDDTPCTLDGFVTWQGGTTPGGKVMPMMYKSVNYPPQPPRQWSSPNGNKAFVHYWPTGQTGYGVTNMPIDKKGNITIGIIVGNGCFSPTNCSLPSCISDTVWYHNFFRFVELNARFNIERFADETNTKEDFCYLRKKGEVINFYYEDTLQDNLLADIWNWGDGTATIDSFYYTSNIDVPSSRKRFEMNTLFIPWQVKSSAIINAGVANVVTTRDTIWRCDDILKQFPPLKIDVNASTYYSGLALKSISHIYTKSSYEQLEFIGNGEYVKRGDITPVEHQMVSNTSFNNSIHRKYLIIGVIDTFTIKNTGNNSEFCSNQSIEFMDSIRYWYSGQNCSRPIFPGENDDDNYDKANLHQWAYTKANYPADSIKASINYDLSDYLIFLGTTIVCPLTHNNLRLVGINGSGNPITRCYKNRTYFHERIYWDFETDGVIDAFGSNTPTNNIKHIFKNPGVYKVSMYSIDSIGAWDTCVAFLTIKPQANINLLPDSTLICEGTSSFTLIPNYLKNYTWYINNVLQPSLNGQYAIYITNQGLYKVTAISNNGCGISDETVVYKMPTQAIVGPKVVNFNTSASYSANAISGHKYNWTVKGGTIASGSGTPNISVLWGSKDSSAWIKLIDSLGSCITSDSIAIIVNGIISVNNIYTKDGFIIYPNPANDKIFISPQYKIVGELEIEIYSVDGKSLKSIQLKDIANTNLSIDIQELKAGFYFIKINGEHIQNTYRFVKQ